MPERTFFRSQLEQNARILFPGKEIAVVTSRDSQKKRIVILDLRPEAAYDTNTGVLLEWKGTSKSDFSNFLGHSETLVEESFKERSRAAENYWQEGGERQIQEEAARQLREETEAREERERMEKEDMERVWREKEVERRKAEDAAELRKQLDGEKMRRMEVESALKTEVDRRERAEDELRNDSQKRADAMVHHEREQRVMKETSLYSQINFEIARRQEAEEALRRELSRRDIHSSVTVEAPKAESSIAGANKEEDDAAFQSQVQAIISHLMEESKLVNQISTEVRRDLEDVLQKAEERTTIGAQENTDSPAASAVLTALQAHMDTEIVRRRELEDTLQKEITRRIEAEEKVSSAATERGIPSAPESSADSAVISALQAHMDTEIVRRRELEDTLQKEIVCRIAAEEKLSAAFKEKVDVASPVPQSPADSTVISALQSHMDAEISRRRETEEALQAEISKRLVAEEALSREKIAREQAAIESTTKEVAPAQIQIDTEIGLRRQAEEALQAEIARRTTAEEALAREKASSAELGLGLSPTASISSRKDPKQARTLLENLAHSMPLGRERPGSAASTVSKMSKQDKKDEKKREKEAKKGVKRTMSWFDSRGKGKVTVGDVARPTTSTIPFSPPQGTTTPAGDDDFVEVSATNTMRDFTPLGTPDERAEPTAMYMSDDTLSKMKEEVKQQVKEEMRASLRSELRDELQSSLQSSLREELEGKMKESSQSSKAEMKTELEGELRAKISEEVEAKVEQRLREELQKQLPSEDAMRLGISEVLKREELRDSILEELKPFIREMVLYDGQ